MLPLPHTPALPTLGIHKFHDGFFLSLPRSPSGHYSIQFTISDTQSQTVQCVIYCSITISFKGDGPEDERPFSGLFKISATLGPPRLSFPKFSITIWLIALWKICCHISETLIFSLVAPSLCLLSGHPVSDSITGSFSPRRSEQRSQSLIRLDW